MSKVSKSCWTRSILFSNILFSNIFTTGENLASLVVALLPVLAHVDEPKRQKGHESSMTADTLLEETRLRTKIDAASIISFLSKGELGTNLASFFAWCCSW